MDRKILDRNEVDFRQNEGGLTTADLARDMEHGRPEEQRAFQDDGQTPLFAENEAKELRSQWERIQIAFVDQPRESVGDADQLVASAIKRLAEMFADERAKLEREWDRGDQVSTEDLRIALKRYRSFFDRILSV